MNMRERLGVSGLVILGAGVLAASFLVKPFVPAALATDTDGDGLPDDLENAIGSLPGAANSDADGWNDWQEFCVYGTCLTNPDTDYDSVYDDQDSDPLNNNNADGRFNITNTWASNLTQPAWTGTSAQDAKGIYPHSGEFEHSISMFGIDPGYGPRIPADLYYCSGITYDGPWGANWDSPLSARVVEQGNGDAYFYPGTGRRYTFTKPGGATVPFTFTSPGDGIYYTLTKNTGNTFTIVDAHGNKSEFDSGGKKTADKDRFDNAVSYVYSSGVLYTATDATGHCITFSTYGTNRFQHLTDGDNREWELTFNYNGQLAKARTPTSSEFQAGRSFQFVYTNGATSGVLNDNLIQAVDPKGQVWLKNEYDSSDRVVKQYLGNDYFTLSYNTGTSVTTVYDREGNQRDWYVPGVVPGWLKEYSNRDVRGSDTGNDDPTYWQTTFGHDSTTKLRTKTVYPRENRVDADYDTKGNVTEIRRKTTDTDTDSSTNDIYQSWEYDTSHYNLVTSHTDVRGNTTEYALETTGALAYKVVVTVTHPTVTYLTPDQTVSEEIVWNSQGQVISTENGEGKATTYNYVGGSSVKKGYLDNVVVDSNSPGLALTTSYTYNNWGDQTSVTNPRGKTTTLTVNEYGWVTKSETGSPQGYEVLYVFDANGNVHFKDVENVDKTNTRDTGNPWFRTTYNFDILDNLTSRVDEIAVSTFRTTSYAYTKNEKLNVLTKPEGNKDQYIYDERDLVYKVTRGYTSAVASTAKSYYDENRNLKKSTNGRGKSWTSTYDLFDRKTNDTNPLGHYAEFILDKAGNATEVKRWEEAGATDVLLAHSKFTYDEMGRRYLEEKGLKGVSTWSWLSTTTEFDKRSLVTKVTDPRNKATSYLYDGAGRQIRVTNPLSHQTNLTLDANGNVTYSSTICATGCSLNSSSLVEMDYDELDRLKEKREVSEVTSTDKHTTTFKYDSLNILMERVDAESTTTTWTHDGLGRVLEESIALGGGAYKKRTWGFDKNNRKTSHKDDANNETTWAWNARDLMTTETYPDSGAKYFEYDDADNVSEWTDPMGTVVTLTYDDNNRNTARSIALGTGVGGTQDESYSFDALDRFIEGQDDDVTVQKTWDSLSRQTSEKSGPNPMSTYGKTTSYTYDEAGNTTRVDYPDGSFYVTRTYDDANRLTKIEDASSNDIVTVGFDSMTARLQSYTFENGTTSNFAYNGFGQVSDLDHKTSTPTTFAGYDMVYDKVGNLLYEEWSHDSGKGNNYAYDNADRLTQTLQSCADPSAEYANPGSQTYGNKIAYNLTDDSDRSSVVTTPYGQSPVTVSYTSNNVHEYTVVGGTNRTYDNAGNLIDDGTFEYAYDYRNQLLTATRKSNSHVEGTYEYDALGRRTKKTLYDSSSVRYYHDGVHEIEEYDGSGNILRKYVYRLDIDSITMMEAKDVADVDNDSNTTETVRLFYHYDSRSNVARLTAAAQMVVEAYEYDPFGNVAIKDKNGGGVSLTQVGNPFDFQRRRRDSETGLLYFRARAYDSQKGHWLQRDPLGVEAGVNAHEFVVSNPVHFRDPLGLSPDAFPVPSDPPPLKLLPKFKYLPGGKPGPSVIPKGGGLVIGFGLWAIWETWNAANELQEALDGLRDAQNLPVPAPDPDQPRRRRYYCMCKAQVFTTYHGGGGSSPGKPKNLSHEVGQVPSCDGVGACCRSACEAWGAELEGGAAEELEGARLIEMGGGGKVYVDVTIFTLSMLCNNKETFLIPSGGE